MNVHRESWPEMVKKWQTMKEMKRGHRSADGCKKRSKRWRTARSRKKV